MFKIQKYMEEIIKKHALKNAIDFKGKANPKAIIGKLILEMPEIKKNIKNAFEKINQVVNEVNSMKINEQYNELKSKYPEILENKPKEKKELKPLPNNDERPIVMRFEPSPSGPLHIGHAYPASLNYVYAIKNKGKMILRISDTNPENIDPEAYDLIKKDSDWLFEKNYTLFIQSDRMEIYYKRAKELIEKNAVYICSCKSEDFRELLSNGKQCLCRNLSIEDNLERWKMMLNEKYKQGEAVMRFKSDIKHKNPAMRDFPLMRINENEHPKQGNKYRVWPLMNFSVAIDDMEMNISHTLRGKDHADNAKKQEMIHNIFKFKTPTAINVGRINFVGFPVSCSKTKILINEGKYENWEDIRIPFLLPLKKRGYLSQTIRDFAIDVGVTQNDKTVSIEDYFKSLNSFNRTRLDSETERYFFINEPFKIQIKNAPIQSLKLNKHPDKKEGHRNFITDDLFYITKEDFEKIMDSDETQIFRLMDCLNFKKENESLIFHSLDYNNFKDKGKLIIHWLPEKKVIKCKIRMPDNKIIQGYCEKEIEKLDENKIIQFERFGFCKLINKEKLEFWFAHK